MHEYRMPVVCTGLQEEQRYDTISLDNNATVSGVIDILISKGFTKILFIGTTIEDSSFTNFRHEFKKCMEVKNFEGQMILMEVKNFEGQMILTEINYFSRENEYELLKVLNSPNKP